VRTSGIPSGSTVASDMAVGSRGSPFTASSNQACQRRKGSSACVKSPLVNHVGCSIGAVSDIARKTLIFRAAPRLPVRARYKGTRKARLWRLRAKAIALALTLGAATSGCSLSYKLDSFMGRDSEKPTQAALGGSASAQAPSQSAAGSPAENDLAYAKAAAAQVLARTEKGASQPWENPGTGARGTVTALADAYTQDGFQCRDFLASYIREGAESWLQGDACRIHQGKWTVRTLRPLKRT
jgi:surface antigen